MHDWNVVVTIHEDRFRQAMKFLEAFGRLGKTDYFNVLVLKVNDIGQFIEDMEREIKTAPMLEDVISRIMPASVTFLFQTPSEFETKLMRVAEPWVPQLSGASFHVRMHRRGFKDRLSSQREEQFLDHFLQDRLDEGGAARLAAALAGESPAGVILS